MRTLLVTASILGSALLMGCTGDIDDATTTDFGDAIATTERAGNGDITSTLTNASASEMLGHLDWRAEDASLAGEVGGQSLDIDGAMHIDHLADEDVNLLLYKLWEVERDAPDVATCVSNEAILCCRSSAWSCRARL